MLNYGSPFHRVAGVLLVPDDEGADGGEPLALHVRYWCDEPCQLQLRGFTDRWAVDFGPLPETAGRWVEHAVPIDLAAPAGNAFAPSANLSGNFGTGDIYIVGAAFFDSNDRQTDVLHHGAPATLKIEYEVRNPVLREVAQVVVVFHRDGLQDVCRLIARDLTFDASHQVGTVRLVIPRVDLTDGTYSLTVMIARLGYYDRHQATFFAINPDVYSCLSRVFDVRVLDTGFIGAGTVTVKDGEWTMS
jgi:hypothetical protein